MSYARELRPRIAGAGAAVDRAAVGQAHKMVVFVQRKGREEWKWVHHASIEGDDAA